METNTKESDPAFATQQFQIDNFSGNMNPIPSGLTKREFFAAMAMQGFISNGYGEDEHRVAIFSLDCADELIKQLNWRQK